MPFTRPPHDADSPKPHSGALGLLGFTHHWGRSRRGNWVVKRKTAKDRFRRAVADIHAWCRDHRHQPVAQQWRVLHQKLDGHYAYYGITGNSRCLTAFRTAVRTRWRFWLNRRSEKGRMPWWRLWRLLERYPLPPPRLIARHRA